MKNLDLCIRLLTDLYCRDAPVIHGAIAVLTKRPAHNIENTLSLSRGDSVHESPNILSSKNKKAVTQDLIKLSLRAQEYVFAMKAVFV